MLGQDNSFLIRGKKLLVLLIFPISLEYLWSVSQNIDPLWKIAQLILLETTNPFIFIERGTEIMDWKIYLRQNHPDLMQPSFFAPILLPSSKNNCHYFSLGYQYDNSAVEITRQITRLACVAGELEAQGAEQGLIVVEWVATLTKMSLFWVMMILR